jgi:hypothetical protein
VRPTKYDIIKIRILLRNTVQKYIIKIVSCDNPEDAGEMRFNQAEINSFLDFAAPYDELKILEESQDPKLVPIVTVEVETDGDFFEWNRKYYSKETYTAMVLHATKKNLLLALNNGLVNPEINS